MERIISDNIDRVAEICRQYHVKRLYVFGSATGQGIDGHIFGPESDVDLLVEFENTVYDFVNFDYISNKYNLIDELAQVFGRKVDLVPQNTLRNPRFIQYVEKQKQLIYAA